MKGHASDWKSELQAIIDRNNDRHATKAKCVSFKTMQGRASFLFAFFTELRRNEARCYKVNPSGLRGRHVQFMVERWVARGLAPGTVQLYLSFLRVFCSWIGKPGMVPPSEQCVAQRAQVQRQSAPPYDRSWTAVTDAGALVARIAQIDVFVGAQLAICLAFGARVKEAIMLQPFRTLGTDGTCLVLDRGTKGGRVRTVPIDSPAKRTALELARRVAVTDSGHLGDPRRSLAQNRARFYTVLRQAGITRVALGITAHGLRHQYANDLYEALACSPSPVRAAADASLVPRELERAARLEVAEHLGHAREAISSAYLGHMLNRRRAATPVAAASVPPALP